MKGGQGRWRRPRTPRKPGLPPLIDLRAGPFPGASDPGWPAPREERRPGVLIDWRSRGYKVDLSIAGSPQGHVYIASTQTLAEANEIADIAAEVVRELRATRPDLFAAPRSPHPINEPPIK